MGTFVGGLGVAHWPPAIFDRDPACQRPLDLAVLSLASFKAAEHPRTR